MKQMFACGHKGKGKYCHTCAASTRRSAEQLRAYTEERAAKRAMSFADPIDLTIVRHLGSVQRQARDLLARVSNGVHPLSLDGKILKSSAGKLLSVPVGRSYRLLFETRSLTPIRLISHEDYNAVASKRAAA
jgi:chaperone required for assembly of F1-ATPase